MEDPNLFWMGMALFLEVPAMALARLVSNKLAPRLNELWSKVVAGVVLAAIPILLGLFGRPNIATIWQRVVYTIPFVGIWLWAMVVFLIWNQVRASGKKLDETTENLGKHVGALWRIVTGEGTKQLVDGAAEIAFLKAANFAATQESELRKELYERLFKIEQALKTTQDGANEKFQAAKVAIEVFEEARQKQENFMKAWRREREAVKNLSAGWEEKLESLGRRITESNEQTSARLEKLGGEVGDVVNRLKGVALKQG
jgi:hypothetical protein